MKIYFSFITVVLMLTFTIIHSPTYGQWEVYNITINQNSPVWGYVGDIDGDDTLDYVASHNKTNEVVWYKNINAGQIWEKDTIDNSLDGAWMVWIADIDGDDDLDVVATGQKANDVVWYENNGGTPINWTKYFIDSNLYDARDFAVADIDGDDTLDVIVSSFAGDDVVWYENDHPNWPKHVIEDNLDGANYICPADLDSDGDPDLIVGGWSADRIVWYENNHPNWNKYDIDPNIDGPVFVAVADLDGDGDPDIAATGENDKDVVWYENDQLTWHKYIIDGNLDDALGVTIGDMDGDDIPDVIAAGMYAHKVVWYKNNLPSDSWTPYTIGYLEYSAGVDVGDIDRDNDLDVVSSSYGAYVGINVGNVVWYKNPGNTAYGIIREVYPKYIDPQGDTLFINAQLFNPENHSVMVHAIIRCEQHAFTDSVQLYDDGQHSDSLASDNIWGNSKWLSGLPEDTYTIGISTHDMAKDEIYCPPPTPSFTTIGPVVEKGATIISSDTIPNPGDYLKFRTNLQNTGLTATALDVSARLTLLDTCASFSNYSQKNVVKHTYGDIDPGEILQSATSSYINFKEQCTDDHKVKFAMEISSNGYHFWSDTFQIDVISGLEDENISIVKEFRLYQNYPNPFNPNTVISWQLAVGSDVELSIYNNLGQKVATLVNRKQKAGYHSVEWDSRDMASGVYYYRLVAGEFVDTKKLLLLK